MTELSISVKKVIEIKGKLIMISGIDGSGKTTVAEGIKNYLLGMGIENVVIVDAMKGGCYTRQLKKCSIDNTNIRQKFSPELLNLTWSADLVYTYEKIVKPYLEKGYYVILHRSDLCCRVYSKVFAENDFISERMIDPANIRADLHFYLNIPPELAYERISVRQEEKTIEVKEKIEYLKRASEIYQHYLDEVRYKNVISINVDYCLGQVLTQVIEIIAEIL